jgi:hypothetical protein
MLSNLQSWTVVGLASLVWLGLVAVGVAQGGPRAALDLGNVIPLLLMAAWAFERWGWRWARIHPHLVNEPVVRGTWRGVLTSAWKDPVTEQSPAPKVVYLAVTQTLTTVKVRLLTNESVSDSVAGSVARTPVGDWAIAYTYSAMPKIERRPGSPPHLGGAILTIVGGPASRIEGEYWTGRSSQGSLNFTDHVVAIAPAVPEAQELFGDVVEGQ